MRSRTLLVPTIAGLGIVGAALAALVAYGYIPPTSAMASAAPQVAATPSPTPATTPQPSQGRAFLGVQLASITPRLKERFNLDRDSGVVVVRVMPDSPASTAGLQVGDVLLSVGDSQVQRVQDVVDAVGRAHPGDRLSLAVRRSGSDQKVEVTLGATPAQTPPQAPAWGPLGLGRLAEGQVTYLDRNGSPQTVNFVVGLVREATADHITLEPIAHQGQTRTFQIGQDTRVFPPRRNVADLKAGDRVTVVYQDTGQATMVIAGLLPRIPLPDLPGGFRRPGDDGSRPSPRPAVPRA